jgi:hypothetical protein
VTGNPLVRLARQCLKAAAYTGIAAGRLLVAPPHGPARARAGDRVRS